MFFSPARYQFDALIVSFQVLCVSVGRCGADIIVTMGNDETDEDVFERVPETAWARQAQARHIGTQR